MDYCRLRWTASAQLLVYARSVPVLDVFDANGAFFYNVTLVQYGHYSNSRGNLAGAESRITFSTT